MEGAMDSLHVFLISVIVLLIIYMLSRKYFNGRNLLTILGKNGTGVYDKGSYWLGKSIDELKLKEEIIILFSKNEVSLNTPGEYKVSISSINKEKNLVVGLLLKKHRYLFGDYDYLPCRVEVFLSPYNYDSKYCRGTFSALTY